MTRNGLNRDAMKIPHDLDTVGEAVYLINLRPPRTGMKTGVGGSPHPCREGSTLSTSVNER